jgi:hypothetical protein
MALTTADLQAIAKERYGVAGTVWHASAAGNDTTGDGLSWATAYATPTKAGAVAAAGDLILLSGAITCNTAVNLTAGVSMCGPRHGPRPVLTTSLANAAFIKPGHGSRLNRFKVVGSAADFQYPIGLFSDNGNPAAADVLIEDVHVVNDTDAIYADVAGCDNWTIRRCLFQTKWDAVIIAGTGTVIEDSDILVVGPSAVGGAGSGSHAVTGGTGTVVRRCRLEAGGGVLDNKGLVGPGAISDSRVTTSGTAAADLTLTGTVIDLGGNAGSGAGGVLTTTGAGTLTRRAPLTAVKDLAEADVTVNTATTPWTLEYRTRGTSTIILTKQLYDVAGAPLVSADTVPGREIG